MLRATGSHGHSRTKQGEQQQGLQARAKREGVAKGRGEALTCHVCGGTGCQARLCPSEGWNNDLEEGMLNGDDCSENLSRTLNSLQNLTEPGRTSEKLTEPRRNFATLRELWGTFANLSEPQRTSTKLGEFWLSEL